MTTLRFMLPPHLIMTSNQRIHWAKRAQLTRQLREWAWQMARARKAPHLERAHLVVKVGWPDRRRRDVHNITPTIKALVDGCVDAGVLPDDDDDHLVGPDLRPYVAGRHGHTIIDLQFTPLDPQES